MTYIYYQFIEWATSKPTENGIVYHKHHITPRSKGGTDSIDNLVKLTPQDHAYAHYLYDMENKANTCKVFKDRLGLPYDKTCCYEDFAPLNEMETVRWERQRSEETRRKIGKAHLGTHASEETRKKMSEARRLYWERRRQGA